MAVIPALIEVAEGYCATAQEPGAGDQCCRRDDDDWAGAGPGQAKGKTDSANA